jgi:hypothetical protein
MNESSRPFVFTDAWEPLVALLLVALSFVPWGVNHGELTERHDLERGGPLLGGGPIFTCVGQDRPFTAKDQLIAAIAVGDGLLWLLCIPDLSRGRRWYWIRGAVAVLVGALGVASVSLAVAIDGPHGNRLVGCNEWFVARDAVVVGSLILMFSGIAVPFVPRGRYRLLSIVAISVIVCAGAYYL